MISYDTIQSLSDPIKMFSLEDRTVLLIGGAGKMGKEFTNILRKAGANICIADISIEKCREVLDQLPANSKEHCVSVKCDSSDPENVDSAINKTVETFGGLDVLIYNVMAKPVGYYAPLDQYSEDTWNQVIASNLSGAFFACSKAIEHLKLSKSGSIILTSSTYGLVGPDNRLYEGLSAQSNLYDQKFPLNTPLAYSTSKAGLLGIVKHMAPVLGEHGIRINALIPGGVFDGHSNIFEERYSQRTVLGRMATWTDYNGAVLFLSSDASRYMTGANLVIDGGWTAW